MTFEAVLAGLAALSTGTLGVVLVIREFRRREHNAARGALDELEHDLYEVDDAYIALRRYAFNLRQLLAEHVDEPAPPPPPAVHRPLLAREVDT